MLRLKHTTNYLSDNRSETGEEADNFLSINRLPSRSLSPISFPRDGIYRIGRTFLAGPTSSLLRALRSALYSMLTSAVPAPPAERYVYLELLATAEDIFLALLGSPLPVLATVGPVPVVLCGTQQVLSLSRAYPLGMGTLGL